MFLGNLIDKFLTGLCYNVAFNFTTNYMTIFHSLGFLRLSLLALGIINAFLSPEPGSGASLEGYKVMTTLVIPASAPIILMVIFFDALMSKIRSSDSSGEESKKYKTIMWAELGVAAFMILKWMPFFMMIGK